MRIGFACLATLAFLAATLPVRAQDIDLPVDESELVVPIRPFLREGTPIDDFRDAYVDLGDGVIISFSEWMGRRYGLYRDLEDRAADRLLTGAAARQAMGWTGPWLDPLRADLALPHANPLICHTTLPFSLLGWAICTGDYDSVGAGPRFAAASYDFAGQPDSVYHPALIRYPLLSLDPQ